MFKSLFNGIETHLTIILIITCIAIICGVAAIAIIKIKVKSLAIIVSTFICAVMMLPTTSLINHLYDINPKANQPSSEELQIKSAELQVKIENLTKEIEAYKHAQFGIQGFNKIAEVALVKTDLTMIEYHNPAIKDSESKRNILGKPTSTLHGTDYLGVFEYKLSPKYGINLKEVEVKELENGKLSISGIKNYFIGSDIPNWNLKVSEIRQVETERKNGSFVQTYKILNDPDSKDLANRKAYEYYNEFADKFNKNEKTEFLDTFTIDLGKEFLKTFLGGFYSLDNIEFVENLDDGKPILDFLAEKIKEKEEEIEKLEKGETE